MPRRRSALSRAPAARPGHTVDVGWPTDHQQVGTRDEFWRDVADGKDLRDARTAESALLRSVSSWSMASATRRRADSSIEHTIEDYQVGDGLGPACRSSVIHRLPTCACGNSMWITHREIHP